MTSVMAPPETGGVPGQPVRTSALAVTSLVLSAVVCCPLTTVAGVLVGIAGVFVTRGGRLRGRWLAIAAVVLGVAATALQGVLVGWAWRTVYEPVMSGPQAALRLGFSSDAAGFQRAFVGTPAEGNTPEAAQAFCDELKRRYGEFESSQMDQQSAGSRPPAAGESFSADYLLQFANGRVRSTTTIEIADASGQLSLRLASLVVHDESRGDLHYPPRTEGERDNDGKQ